MARRFECEWGRHAAGFRTHGLAALSAATIIVSAFSIAQSRHAAGSNSNPLRAGQKLAHHQGTTKARR